MSKIVFALDIGNKQTKIKNKNTEYILPSHFLNAENMGSNFGGTQETSNHEFKVPFSNEKFVWGETIDTLHLDTYMLDTLIRGNRYADESFKLLTNFAIGLLGKNYDEAKNGILDVYVVSGMPTKDYNEEAKRNSLHDVLKGQHQVEIDGETYTIRVMDVYLVPQPIGTLYDELLGDDGLTIINDHLRTDKVGIIDIGGGTILIDTILNFRLITGDSKQLNTGINDLYKSIASNMDGEVSLYKLAKTLRAGNSDQEWVYQYSRNNMVNITELVKRKIGTFTKQQINQINTTLDDLISIDTLLFTGGGSNLIDKKLIKESFVNAKFVSNSETTNVNGFYKFGLNYTSTDD